MFLIDTSEFVSLYIYKEKCSLAMLHTGIGFYVYDVLLTLKFYYWKPFKMLLSQS